MATATRRPVLPDGSVGRPPDPRNHQQALGAVVRWGWIIEDPAGNRDDRTACRDSGIGHTLAARPVMTDGGYQSSPGVIMYGIPLAGRPDS